MRKKDFLRTVLTIHSSKAVEVEPDSEEGEHFLADALILNALKLGRPQKVMPFNLFISNQLSIIRFC